ncbi:MAG: hypothetical protein M1831_000287 [Alyxoria varia]|nr:MAG: hypothetical protein M1831_000287 [Alyxoria varia]
MSEDRIQHLALTEVGYTAAYSPRCPLKAIEALQENQSLGSDTTEGHPGRKEGLYTSQPPQALATPIRRSPRCYRSTPPDPTDPEHEIEAVLPGPPNAKGVKQRSFAVLLLIADG